jgi:acetyl-CoA carboxylase biotin carboxyl carrier protein
MDIEEIKTLTSLMVDNDLSEIMIRDGDKRILLRRHGANEPATLTIPAALAPPAAAAATTASPVAAAGEVPAADAGLEMITSPMVGTFYAASDPDASPFVKVGDHVSPDTVIAIIEAMKVFNEIKAEVAGTIESIAVRNADPVEFGQLLMKVRPD